MMGSRLSNEQDRENMSDRNPRKRKSTRPSVRGAAIPPGLPQLSRPGVNGLNVVNGAFRKFPPPLASEPPPDNDGQDDWRDAWLPDTDGEPNCKVNLTTGQFYSPETGVLCFFDAMLYLSRGRFKSREEVVEHFARKYGVWPAEWDKGGEPKP
jgi:hypothetical protein